MRTLHPLRYHRPTKQIEPGKGPWLLAGAVLAWLALWSVDYGFRAVILAIGGAS